VPRATQDTDPRSRASPTGLSPCFVDLSSVVRLTLKRFGQSYNPAPRKERFGLIRFRSPLLAESFLFLGVLRCFSSSGSLALRRNLVSARLGFPIRIWSAQSPHTAPRPFSQCTTSFVGSWRPGIPRSPLVTSCLMRKTRLLSEPRFRGANPDRFSGQGCS
jgi:hypothetical protein